MNAPSNLLITGFMAAGKTVVAAAVSQLLGCEMIDLDHVIYEKEMRSAQAIIDEEGEDSFRIIESEALGYALKSNGRCVIALGGGTWTLCENRAIIAEQNGLVVWLDTPIDLCWERISNGGGTRPLARDYEATRVLFEERRPIYALSDIRVDGGLDRSVENVAIEIAGLAKKSGWMHRRNTREDEWTPG